MSLEIYVSWTSFPKHQMGKDSNTKDDVKFKTAQANCQDDNSLLPDGDQAFQNKANKTEKWANSDNESIPQQQDRPGTVRNKLPWGS